MIELYEYQKKYLSDLPARSIMAADTGTGKTFMALAHYARHAAGRPLLILAPASKIRTGDWERDVEEFFGDNKPVFEVYSYEKFSREPTNKAFREGKRAIWRRFAPRYGSKQWAVIADEVHRAKNPQSNIGSSLFEVAKDAEFFVGLSATPLPNGWIDFANYSKIFGYTKGITAFKQRYCDIVTYKGFPEIRGYWRESELLSQWQAISKRLVKSDALDLPSRTFIGVDFKRPAEYVKALMDRRDDDGNEIESISQLVHFIRQKLTKPKMDYLADLIDGTDENVVVFYNYISERDEILGMLGKRFKDRPVYRQDGSRHEVPTKSEWPSIKRSVTVSHYRSGSTGVEMTYATQVIYFSPTYSYAEYLQSIGRVYRNGQSEKTTFYNFRTPDTIEEDIYKVLITKNDFQVAQWLGAE